jgi:hypothetical protein
LLLDEVLKLKLKLVEVLKATLVISKLTAELEVGVGVGLVPTRRLEGMLLLEQP